MTPGFAPTPIPAHESVEAASRRLSADLDRVHALRSAALIRARECEWPGITAQTRPDLPGCMGNEPDPIGDFMAAEIAAKARLSARVFSRAA